MSAGEIVVKNDNPNMILDYFDQLHCDKIQDHEFRCTGWQPDWNLSAGEGVRHGYPRFGTEELVTPGVIKADATDDIDWTQVRLRNALPGLSAACTGLIAALWF